MVCFCEGLALPVESPVAESSPTTTPLSLLFFFENLCDEEEEEEEEDDDGEASSDLPRLLLNGVGTNCSTFGTVKTPVLWPSMRALRDRTQCTARCAAGAIRLYVIVTSIPSSLLPFTVKSNRHPFETFGPNALT
jgi:hypothetical protein